MHAMESIRIGEYLVITKMSLHKQCLFSSGTKEFTISVSDNETGPWKEIISGLLADPRQHEGSLNPQESEIFPVNPVLAHYVKFSCISYYGNGCVLQYIEAFEGNAISYNVLVILHTSIFVKKIFIDYGRQGHYTPVLPILLFRGGWDISQGTS